MMQQGTHSDARPFLKNPTTRAALWCSFMLLFASGCAMNETQQRTGTGAAIGALGGALLGTSRESAAIGAAVGAAGGYLYDQSAKQSDAKAENDRLRRENERLRIEAESQASQ